MLFSYTRFTIFSKRLVLEPNVQERHVCEPVILLTIFASAQPMINSTAYLNPPEKRGQLNTIHPNMKQRPRKISIHIYMWKRFYSYAQRNHNQECRNARILYGIANQSTGRIGDNENASHSNAKSQIEWYSCTLNATRTKKQHMMVVFSKGCNAS